ncbi:hypothetical protein AAC387_Pa07g2229 [Persea americana]
MFARFLALIVREEGTARCRPPSLHRWCRTSQKREKTKKIRMGLVIYPTLVVDEQYVCAREAQQLVSPVQDKSSPAPTPVLHLNRWMAFMKQQ